MCYQESFQPIPAPPEEAAETRVQVCPECGHSFLIAHHKCRMCGAATKKPTALLDFTFSVSPEEMQALGGHLGQPPTESLFRLWVIDVLTAAYNQDILPRLKEMESSQPDS